MPNPCPPLDKLRPRAKQPDEPVPDFWTETWESVTRTCRFDEFGNLSVKVIDDSRPIFHRMIESFMNNFFPSGYPYSAAISVLSTQGMAVVAARASRLPIYSSYAKENNLSDLFAKGEAIMVLETHNECMRKMFQVLKVQLLKCSRQENSGDSKGIHQDWTCIESCRFEVQRKPSFLDRLIKEAGNVTVRQQLHEVVRMPSRLRKAKEMFLMETFMLICGNKWMDMISEHGSTGEGALRGWLVAAYSAGREKPEGRASMETLSEAYVKMNLVFPSFITEVQKRGCLADQFLGGSGSRFAWRFPTVSGAVASSSG